MRLITGVLLFPLYCICILLCLLTPPTLLTPLPQSIPCKSRPQAAASANTIPPALPCSSKAQETAAYTGAGLQGEREGGGEEVRRSGIEWRAGERRGILREGSQSNYRQRCSPGFFGGTKFTFQRSLPPSPSIPSPSISASSCYSFSYFFSSWLTLTPPNRASPHTLPFPCLSWLHESGKGIELYHRQSFKSCHRIAVSCSHLKEAFSILPPVYMFHATL